MKLKLLGLVLGAVLAFGGVATSAMAGERPAGPEVPFPLSAQLPFPWATIEGIWEAKGTNVNALFSFQVRSDDANRKILKVLELDPETGEVIANGTGITQDDTRVVRAVMVSPSRRSYWLMIRAFQDTKSLIPRVATVLTVSPFAGTAEDVVHVVVRRVSDMPCDGKLSGIRGR